MKSSLCFDFIGGWRFYLEKRIWFFQGNTRMVLLTRQDFYTYPPRWRYSALLKEACQYQENRISDSAKRYTARIHSKSISVDTTILLYSETRVLWATKFCGRGELSLFNPGFVCYVPLMNALAANLAILCWSKVGSPVERHNSESVLGKRPKRRISFGPAILLNNRLWSRFLMRSSTSRTTKRGCTTTGTGNWNYL